MGKQCFDTWPGRKEIYDPPFQYRRKCNCDRIHLYSEPLQFFNIYIVNQETGWGSQDSENGLARSKDGSCTSTYLSTGRATTQTLSVYHRTGRILPMSSLTPDLTFSDHRRIDLKFSTSNFVWNLCFLDLAQVPYWWKRLVNPNIYS